MSQKKITLQIRTQIQKAFNLPETYFVRIQYRENLNYNKNFRISSFTLNQIKQSKESFFYIALYNTKAKKPSYNDVSELSIYEIPVTMITNIFNIKCLTGKDKGKRFNSS